MKRKYPSSSSSLYNRNNFHQNPRKRSRGTISNYPSSSSFLLPQQQQHYNNQHFRSQIAQPRGLHNSSTTRRIITTTTTSTALLQQNNNSYPPQQQQQSQSHHHPSVPQQGQQQQQNQPLQQQHDTQFDTEEEFYSFYDNIEPENQNPDNFCDNDALDPEFQSYEEVDVEVASDDDTNMPPPTDATADGASSSYEDVQLDILIENVKALKNIPSLYPWQQELLSRPDLRQQQNLVYAVPTSGGKTLPAETLVLHTVKNRQKSAMFIVPYISLVNEKVKDFENYDLGDLDVDAYFSYRGLIPPLEGPRIMVATIEKAVTVLNSLVENDRVNELGLVVIDEFHLVGDNRGVHLECMLSKLLFLKEKGLHSPQIVGMSATIPNLHHLAKWIRGSVYQSDFRPVPLQEHLVHILADTKKKQSHIFQIPAERTDATVHRTLSSKPLLDLIVETLESEQSSMLVFCGQKLKTEKHCRNFGKAIKSNEQWSHLWNQNEEVDKLKRILGRRVDPLSLSMGFGVHHADLNDEQRRAVEDAFRSKQIRVLFCTSTLAAGVNLPAARVVLDGLMLTGKHITKGEYTQMCGRAGRAGYDSFGESFLLVPSNHVGKAWDLANKSLDSIQSRLTSDAIEKLIMESVKYLEHMDDISLLSSCTLMNTLEQEKGNETECTSQFTTALQKLKNDRFLRERTLEEIETEAASQAAEAERRLRMQPNALQQKLDAPTLPLYELGQRGRAISSASIGVQEASNILSELKDAMDDGIVLGNALHIMYFLTPSDLSASPNFDSWLNFQDYVSTMDTVRSRILKKLGIDPVVLGRLGATPKSVSVDDRKKHVRFFIACVLQDIIEEADWKHFRSRYNLNPSHKGMLRRWRENAAHFASTVLRLCDSMEWAPLASIIKVYMPRIAEGCREDLLPLLEIDGIGKSRARLLFSIGIKTPEALAAETQQTLTQKMGQRFAQTGKQVDMILENAQRFVQRKLREHRRQIEKMDALQDAMARDDTQH